MAKRFGLLARCVVCGVVCCVACAGTAFAAAGDTAVQGGSGDLEPATNVSPFLSLGELRMLERVNALYPWQTLGVMRVNGRALLIGSSAFLPGASPRPTAGSGALSEQRIRLTSEFAERYGLTRSARGDVLLAAGKSVYLVDPVTPELVVELKADSDRPLVLDEILASGSRPGIFAGLSTPGTSADAALQGPEGRIFFIVTAKPLAVEKPAVAAANRGEIVTSLRETPAPQPAPVRAIEPEHIPPVIRAVEPWSEPISPVARAVEPRPEPSVPVMQVEIAEERKPPSAAVPAGVVMLSAEKDSYASALRTLHERQGRAWLRAVEQPQRTQAVDHALHALGFAR